MKKYLIVILGIWVMVGCAPRLYVSPSLKLQRIRKIAILPFEAKEEHISKYVTRVFKQEFLIRAGGRYEIVNEETEADAVIRGVIGEYDYHTEWVQDIFQKEVTAIKIPKEASEGAQAKAEATASVTIDKGEAFDVPTVSINIQLLDPKMQKILYSGAFYKRGEECLGKVTKEVIEELVNSLVRELK